MPQQGQKMRFTDAELALMKSLFAGNEQILFIIRKVMLQFEINNVERKMLLDTLTEPAQALLRKLFLPELESDTPLFQLTHLYIGLNSDLRNKGVDECWPLIRARDMEIKYFNQQLIALKEFKFDKYKIKFADLVKMKKNQDKEDAYVNLTVWNYVVSYVDSNIQQAIFLAGMKEESVDETKARLAKDSTE